MAENRLKNLRGNIRAVDVPTDKIWHEGQPPHIGWWWARTYGAIGLRWWDGKYWSVYVDAIDSIEDVIFASVSRSIYQKKVFWCWLWPVDAIVARINPDTGECTGAGPVYVI
jgi:hypothetical protein